MSEGWYEEQRSQVYQQQEQIDQQQALIDTLTQRIADRQMDTSDMIIEHEATIRAHASAQRALQAQLDAKERLITEFIHDANALRQQLQEATDMIRFLRGQSMKYRRVNRQPKGLKRGG